MIQLYFSGNHSISVLPIFKIKTEPISMMNIQVLELCQITFLSTSIWLFVSILKTSNAPLQVEQNQNSSELTELVTDPKNK